MTTTTSMWNYVVTAQKPTSVTHSCVGNFTSPDDINLIIAKCTRIEIHRYTPGHRLHPGHRLQLMLDVPIYGRIATLELFRPCGEELDFLFIVTEGYKYCVLQWDVEASELITRATGDGYDPSPNVRPASRQIAIIDPDCKYIALHLYEGFIKVIPLDNKGQLKEAVKVGLPCTSQFRLIEMPLDEWLVLDIKFLYGHSERPTIAVLYEENRYRTEYLHFDLPFNLKRLYTLRHVKTYRLTEMFLPGELMIGPWSQKNLDNGAGLLIPVPMPLGGVIIIGEESIAYCSADTFITIPTIAIKPVGVFSNHISCTASMVRARRIPVSARRILMEPSITRAYGRDPADGFRYLLSDNTGLLHLLVITHEKKKVTALKLEDLGYTSFASSISYIDKEVVYIGSSSGDSQLIKLNVQPVAKASHVNVLESFVNLGPIVDFCVVERQGHSQVVTCSGACKDGSLRVVRNGIGIIEQASVELQGIIGLWSLRSSTYDPHDTFLVVSLTCETRILAMNMENGLEEIEMEGFHTQTETLFCKSAINDQLVQVTSDSVLLVSSKSRKLLDSWTPPDGFSVNVATANASQVLLAAGCHLFYIEIGRGKLTQVTCSLLDYQISCLDINPINDYSLSSRYAAVGMWTEISIRMYSLPDLVLMTTENLGREIIPRSVLLCKFEEVSYLLCALGDGYVFNFLLDRNTGKLSDRRKILLGTQPITLCIFSSMDTTHVLATSDGGATMIYSSHKKLLYSNVNLKEVSDIMCPFNPAALKSSLAIAREGKLSIGTIDDIRIRSIPLREHATCICHQEQTRTFAICSYSGPTIPEDFNRSTYNANANAQKNVVRLFDDLTFECISIYTLGPGENGLCIISCSFSNDSSVYYCVGTAFCWPSNSVGTGRILVFGVENGKLRLIAGDAGAPVHSLKAFNGKLLVVREKIVVYHWSGGRLRAEFEHDCKDIGINQPVYVQTRGDFIVIGDTGINQPVYNWNRRMTEVIAVGDISGSISLLLYKGEKVATVKRAVTAVEILDDDIYLGAEVDLNLFTVQNNIDGAAEFVNRLEVVGEYHLGEYVNRFRHGSLVMSLPGSEYGQIPTVIFGTRNGVIGLIASLPHDQYVFLERLQGCLNKVIKGVGGFIHEQWRAFTSDNKTSDARNFLDGDLIESFLDLKRVQMEEISTSMEVPVEELCERVVNLTRLH